MKSYINRFVMGSVLVVVVITAVTAFTFNKKNNKVHKDGTRYYWFDADGDYLYRQSTVDQEIFYSGFDDAAYAPYTLQEKGFAPGVVSGNPPVPNNPWMPNIRLYSHP